MALASRLQKLFVLPERFKGTIVERWARYWKFLMIDYREVAFSVGRDARAKPVKTLFYVGTGSAAYYCARNNPDEEDYAKEIKHYQHEMGLLPESMQNRAAKDHLLAVERCYAAGLVRRLNLGVATVMWRHNYNSALDIYKANCSYVGPDWSRFGERILDVGFLNRFWILSRKMEDFDVDEE